MFPVAWLKLQFWVGDKDFKYVGIYKPLAVDEVPPNIAIEWINVSTKIFSHERYLFEDKENLLENCGKYGVFQTGNRAISTWCGFSLSVIIFLANV